MNFTRGLAAAAAAKAASVGSQVASAAGDLLEKADEKAGAVISEQLAQTPSTATRKSASAVFDDETEEVSALRQQLEEAQEGQRRATLAVAELSQAEAALASELAASKAEAVQLQERERAVKAKVVEKLRTQGDELSKRDELIRSLRSLQVREGLEEGAAGAPPDGGGGTRSDDALREELRIATADAEAQRSAAQEEAREARELTVRAEAEIGRATRRESG